jgi:hypothetical protein
LIAPSATPTPAFVVVPPHVEISASATSVRVGETITIGGVPLNIGLPIYTLTLSSGASASVTYDNQIRGNPAPDALFEVVAAHGEMNSVTFTLRALAPGSADAGISASGEVRTHEGAYMWKRRRVRDADAVSFRIT